LLRSSADLKLPERDARILIVCSHLLPLFDFGDARSPHSVLGVGNRCVGRHVSDLNKGNRNETWPTKAPDGLRNKPLRIRLGDDDNGLAGLRL